MGIFSRGKDIVNANINALLDKADNPEKMIRLMIQEMEDTLVDLRTSSTAKLAEQKKTQRQLTATGEAIARWASRAALAVEKGKDNLAREAIAEKQALEKRLTVLQENLEHYDVLVLEAKDNILQIEEKLATVREKHRLLLQRARHAEESVRTKQTLRESSGSKAFERFAILESRIERMEAEAEIAGVAPPPSGASVDAQFREMETNQAIEDELAALKQAGKPVGGQFGEQDEDDRQAGEPVGAGTTSSAHNEFSKEA